MLLIAAVKAQLVIGISWRFDSAPVWLKVTTSSWVLGLFALLLGFYFAGLS